MKNKTSWFVNNLIKKKKDLPIRLKFRYNKKKKNVNYLFNVYLGIINIFVLDITFCSGSDNY